MGWYEAFRDEQRPVTHYEEKHTSAASVDLFMAELIFAFLAITFSFLILLPGYMGKERYSIAIRMMLSLFIAAGILFSNYGMGWEGSSVKSETQYKAFMSKEIEAEIGVKIGLRGVNVTLKGLPVEQKFDSNKTTEHVDYNENFQWNRPWRQGREGFGEHASQVNNEYHSALHRGIPYPILLVAEYFTVDGERMRWGRSFRLAGFFTQLLLWLAFSLWLITNILFLMVIRYGAYFLSLTGVIILTGNVVYDLMHYGAEFTIPFPAGNLDFHYGWCFWLSMVTGLLCFFLGVLILALDYFAPGEVALFFNIDIETEFEEVVEVREIFTEVTIGDVKQGSASDENGMEMTEMEEPVKRVQFVATSRYAGIAHLNPRKKPLDVALSLPSTSTELVEDVRRRSISLSLDMEQGFNNQGFGPVQYQMDEINEDDDSENDTKTFNGGSPC